MGKSKKPVRKSGAAVLVQRMVRPLTKKQREDRACDAIISGILHGFTQKDWLKVFEKMDKAKITKEQKHQATLRSLENRMNDIFGRPNE
jgi:hypothetical protein